MEEFLSQWDVAIDDPSKDKAKLYQAMVDQLKEHHHNVELLWRLVQACLVMADSNEKAGDKAESKKFTEESLEYAKKAVQYGPKSLQAHKWYCASVGRMSAHVGTKERIKFGYEFKEHRDQAVKIDPNDRLMNHMYGRWCYEIASLSFIESSLAKEVYGSPPRSSYTEALESLLKADHQLHDWKANQMWLAKVYISQKKYIQAAKCIEHGLALPTVSDNDAVTQIALSDLLEEHIAIDQAETNSVSGCYDQAKCNLHLSKPSPMKVDSLAGCYQPLRSVVQTKATTVAQIAKPNASNAEVTVVSAVTSTGGGSISGTSATGGTSIGGSSAIGGASIGGSSATGGGSISGTSATGGTSIGGSSAIGGANIGGSSATGGGSISGTSATGGTSIGGSSATGGASIGGSSATGGGSISGTSAAGGTSIGGSSATGGGSISGTSSMAAKKTPTGVIKSSVVASSKKSPPGSASITNDATQPTVTAVGSKTSTDSDNVQRSDTSVETVPTVPRKSNKDN